MPTDPEACTPVSVYITHPKHYSVFSSLDDSDIRGFSNVHGVLGKTARGVFIIGSCLGSCSSLCRHRRMAPWPLAPACAIHAYSGLRMVRVCLL